MIENINKKLKEQHIFFWLILFYPIAIYRLIKYKIIPNSIIIITTIIMTLLFLCIGIGVYDMTTNPTRMLDHKLLTELKSYKLGTTREIEYLGLMTDDFGIYEVITTNGFYHIYFSVSNNEIQIDGIKELLNNKTIKWNSLLPSEYKDIPAPILSLFINEKEYSQNISNIETTDLNRYVITYKDNTKYLFDIKYYKVYQIFDITNNINELKYTCKTLITFKNDFQKIINKNMNIYKNVEKIISYEVTDDKIEYTFENFCNNSYKIIKYNDGSYDIQKSDKNISNDKMEKQWKEYQKNNNKKMKG